LVTTVLVVVLNAWTIMILVTAAEKHQVFDLGGVLGLLPGRLGAFMQVFSNIMVWVALFGSLVSYIIVMHDSALPFLTGTFLDSRLLLVSVSSIIVLPLCFLDQRYLSWSSMVAFLVNIYLVVLLFVSFGHDAAEGALPQDTCILGFGTGNVAMVSALMQCIIIQMCVLPMYEELENRTPRKFFRVLALSFGTLAVVFSGLASVGYLLFGPGVQSNILLNVSKEKYGVWADVAQVGTIFVVAAIYPIMVIPMVAPFRNMSRDWFAGPDAPASVVHRRRELTVSGIILGIVAVSFVGALCIDSLGIVNTIDGSLCVGVFTALLPGCVGIYLTDRDSLSWKISMFMLLGMGLVMSLLGFYFNRNYAEELESACIWPRNISHETVMAGA